MSHREMGAMRRRLVLGASAFGATQLAACAACRPRERMPTFAATVSLDALRPTPPKSPGSSPGTVVDAHAHFFNARDVQVLGFVKGPVAHSMPEMAELIRAIAPVVEALSHLAPTPAAEMSFLQGVHDRVGRMSAQQGREAFEAGVKERRELRLRELHKGLNADPSFRSEFQRALGRRALPTGEVISLEELTRAANRGTAFESGEVKALDLRSAQVAGVLRFAALMLNYRIDNLHSFVGTYGQRDDGAAVVGAVDALVEFNHWLGDPCKASRMLDQVRLHEQLVRLSGGFLLPVVGYNPATDLRENGAAIAVVNEAITKHGCIGVKIYPPNGYLPFGNKSGKCPVPRNLPPWWDGKKLDDRLKALYELCDRLGVPVMAHANESMGEDDDHDRLAGACGWRELASRQDVALTSLTVNAGHFGGDGSTNKDWTEQFTALMGTGPRLKLFADLGYWSDLESSEAARQRLRSALNRTLPDGTRVLDRVMYGSDWLMMSQVEGYQRFPATVLRLLRDMGLPSQDVANVMGRNALACFKLRAGDLNFNRFAKTFGDSVLRQAAWANL